MHDVAVLDDVVLALDGELAGGAAFGFGAVFDEVVVLDDFGADEAFLEVGVDDSGGAGSLVALVDGPGADFGLAGGEVGAQAEQVVGGADQALDARVFQAQLLEEHLALVVTLELGYLGLDLGGDDQHSGVLSGDGLTDAVHIGIAAGSRGLVHIADVQYGLGGEQEELMCDLLLLRVLQRHGTGRLAGQQGIPVPGQYLAGLLGVLVSPGSLFLELAQTALDGLQVLELQLEVDDLLVPHRVHTAVHMGDIGVIETAEYVQDSISLADIGQKLVA